MGRVTINTPSLTLPTARPNWSFSNPNIAMVKTGVDYLRVLAAL